MHMHCVQTSAIGGFASPIIKSSLSLSSTTMAMPSPNSLRVAAAQMTSVSDLAANFATCSRLVKVFFFSIFSFLGSLYFLSYFPLLLYILFCTAFLLNTEYWVWCAKEAASAGAKLLCFPEAFSYVGTKDGDSVSVAQPLDGPIMNQYCSLARESSIWLSLGGFQEKGSDPQHLCNTHVIVDETGKIRSSYRKIHLFDVDVPGGRVYKESSFTEPGKDIVAVDSPIGRLGLSVCYDLRFPEMYQLLRFQHEAQVLLVPSAFTKVTGAAHWEILLRARAIETQCYVIAAAQTGKHGDKRESYGDTLIIDPWGTIVGRLPDRLSTGIVVSDIDLSLVDSVREKMPIDKQRMPVDFWKAASL